MPGCMGIDKVGVAPEVGELGLAAFVDLTDQAEAEGPAGAPEDEDPGIGSGLTL